MGLRVILLLKQLTAYSRGLYRVGSHQVSSTPGGGVMALGTLLHVDLLLQNALFHLHNMATKEPILTLRVKSHDARNSPMIPTPYPSGLLRPMGQEQRFTDTSQMVDHEGEST